ncbi:MAG: GGDEF domain-containing protein [Treponema sp.]|nr:GGDEF domain-containing protein [Treponema sp.]
MKRKIAVLTCGWSSYFLVDFINGLKRAAKDQNIDIYIFDAYDYVEFSGFPNYTGYSIFGLIHYEDFNGVIILADLINNQRVLERERLRVLKAGIPAITINKKLNGISCIHIDNYSGFYELINHLIKVHGISDLMFVGGQEKSVDFAERYKAFRLALQDNNIPFESEKVISLQGCEYNYAYDWFSHYLKDGKPCPKALVCANDLTAYAIMKVASENKIKIPDDLRVVGYDDLNYSRYITPALSTVRGNSEQAGFEALSRLFNLDGEVLLKIKSLPVFRSTCGCAVPATVNQNAIITQLLDFSNKQEAFNSQIDQMNDIFSEAADVFTLLTNLEMFFSRSHKFEGSDFCVFMRSDWSSILINSSENLPQNLSYGPNLQAVCSIQGDKKYLREMIPVRELVPAKMKAGEESNVFLFIPIFHHSYVHGYFVSKNNLSMLDNNFGYNWTHNFGTCIERFRKKNMYKQMSQQFLKLSTQDALSGMLNRVGLEKLARPYYSQNKKNGLTTVLFFVDINKMKTINDKFGHLHGDLAVKTIAAAVMEVVPKNWLCIRYGGDEFLVVGNSRNYNGEDYCVKITERISQKTKIMKLPYTLSASVGSYLLPSNSNLTLEQAVEEVDKIMYKKKQEFHKNEDKEDK